MARWSARIVRSFRRASPREVQRALGPKVSAVAQTITMSPFATQLGKTGFDEVHFGAAKLEAIGWLDPKHRRGCVFSPEGALLAWVRDGKLVPLGRSKLPPKLAAALRRIRPAAPAVEALTARQLRTVGTLDDAKKLPALERAQLAAACRDLCGKVGLEALFGEAGERELVYARFSAAGRPRWDAWLWSSLDDGVFFEHRKKASSGLAVSQARVHDMKRDREAEVAALQAGLRKL